MPSFIIRIYRRLQNLRCVYLYLALISECLWFLEPEVAIKIYILCSNAPLVPRTAFLWKSSAWIKVALVKLARSTINENEVILHSLDRQIDSSQNIDINESYGIVYYDQIIQKKELSMDIS